MKSNEDGLSIWQTVRGKNKTYAEKEQFKAEKIDTGCILCNLGKNGDHMLKAVTEGGTRVENFDTFVCGSGYVSWLINFFPKSSADPSLLLEESIMNFFLSD